MLFLFNRLPENVIIAWKNLGNKTYFIFGVKGYPVSHSDRVGFFYAFQSYFTSYFANILFAIFREHIAPRGVLLFTSGPDHGEAIGSLYGEPLYHASLAADEYRCLLGRNGFEVVQHVVEDPACGGHTVWLAQAV